MTRTINAFERIGFYYKDMADSTQAGSIRSCCRRCFAAHQDLAVRAAVDASLAVEPIEAGAHEVVAGSTEHQVGVELPVHNVATTADEASGITLTG